MYRRALYAQCETTQVRAQGKGAALFGYTSLYGSVPGGQAVSRTSSRSATGPVSTIKHPLPSRMRPGGCPARAPQCRQRVRYPGCYGRLRDILRHATDQGFVIHDVQTETLGGPQTPVAPDSAPGTRMVEVTLHIHGSTPSTT
jgi:hypothetical protein